MLVLNSNTVNYTTLVFISAEAEGQCGELNSVTQSHSLLCCLYITLAMLVADIGVEPISVCTTGA